MIHRHDDGTEVADGHRDEDRPLAIMARSRAGPGQPLRGRVTVRPEAGLSVIRARP
jgi:hypothetical protein